MRLSCAGTLIYYLTLPAWKVGTLPRDPGFPTDVHTHLLTYSSTSFLLPLTTNGYLKLEFLFTVPSIPI